MKTTISARITTVLLTLVLILSAMFTVSVSAAEVTTKTVRVGFYEMDGYHMNTENGTLCGCGYDFLQLVARYSNLRFEYVGYDKGWEEMQQMLKNGEIDLLTGARKTAEREEYFGFTSTLIGTSAAILTVKAGDNRYSSGNYNGMRIGLVRGNSSDNILVEYMASRGFSYTPVYYTGMNDLTVALQDGKDIDAAMTSTLRRTENEWTLETLDSSPYYAMVGKDNVELLSLLNDAIARMDADAAGWRTKLKNEYYTMDSGEVVAFTAEERAYIDALNKSGKAIPRIL